MKAQVFQAEIIISLLLVLAALGTAWFFLAEQPYTYPQLAESANTIANYLLTPGVPNNWNSTTVTQVGIVNESWRVNQTKLEAFYAMNANTTYALFGENIYVQLFNATGAVQLSAKDYAGEIPSENSTIAAVTRYIIYDSQPHKLVVSIWE